MAFDGPYPHDSTHAGPESIRSRGLSRSRPLAIIPGLVEEQHNEDELQGSGAARQPHDIGPMIGGSQDKVAKAWAQIWRGNVQDGPQSNLAGALVEEEDVFQDTNRDGLCRGKEQAHHEAEGNHGVLVTRKTGAEGKGEADESRPEEDRGASPARC